MAEEALVTWDRTYQIILEPANYLSTLNPSQWTIDSSGAADFSLTPLLYNSNTLSDPYTYGARTSFLPTEIIADLGEAYTLTGTNAATYVDTGEHAFRVFTLSLVSVQVGVTVGGGRSIGLTSQTTPYYLDIGGGYFAKVYSGSDENVEVLTLTPQPGVLFTTGADTVNFNNLTTSQQAAIAAGANLYNGLGGSDVVTLPNVANYNESVGNGATLGWNPAQTFTTGSLAGDTYTVNGGDGSYNIALGAGGDSVNITGDGNSTITAGSGAETINDSGAGNNTINGGAGNYTITLGDGANTVNLTDAGTSLITVGSGNDTIADTGTGNNTITGSTGNYTITLGGGADIVNINGDGSSTITLGSGQDTVNITGNGNVKIIGGVGTANISIDGTGVSTFTGNLTGEASVSGGGSLSISGSLSATPDSTIAVTGSGSTLNVGGTLAVEGVGESLDITGGGALYAGQSAALGDQAGSDVSATIDGAGSLLSVAGNIELGGGATVDLAGGGSLTAGTSGSGAVLTVDAGADISGTGTISDFAPGGSIANSGTIEAASDGTLALNAQSILGAGDFNIENNSKLELADAVGSNVVVQYLNSEIGTLILDEPSAFQGTIQGMAPGDSIELPGVNYKDAATILTTAAAPTNDLLIYRGGTPGDGSTYSFQLASASNYSGGFYLGLYGSSTLGGTLISYVPNPVAGGQGIDSAGYSVTQPPYSAVVEIEKTNQIANPNSTVTSVIGTGFIIGPNTILTAAHVVVSDLSPNYGQVLSNITVDLAGPNGTTIPVQVNPAFVHPDPAYVPGNTSAANSQYDFAVIDLPGQSLSDYGVFGLFPGYSGGTVNVTGYHYITNQSNNFGTAIQSQGSNTLYNTTARSYQGDSGGPVWFYNGLSYQAVGIVSTGPLGGGPGGYDVQLTADDLSLIKAWEADDEALWAVPASVASVTASSQTNSVASGQQVVITLQMTGALTVNAAGGSPTLKLNDGGVATYDANTSSPTEGLLNFDYTVGTNDSTSNLSVLAVTQPTGTTILGSNGQNAQFSAAINVGTGIQVGAAASPAVTQVSALPATGDEGIGATISITLTFSAPVTVTGAAPALTLNDGGTATHVSGSGTNTLTFTYTVASTDTSVPALAITGVTNAASVADAAGNAAKFAAANTTFTGLQIDTVIPAITSIIATPASGLEQVGSTITIAVQFSEAVTVGDPPSLTLNNGGVATYASGSGTNTLTFTYKVGVNDQSVPALAVAGINLNGATIADAAGNAANIAGASQTFGGLQIDTVTPVITQVVTSAPSGSDIGLHKTITVTVDFSKPVTVTGAPRLILNDGGVATYTGGSGTSALTFSFTVATGQNTTDLQATGIALPGRSSIKDASGDVANLAGAKVDLGLQIDTVIPVVSAVAASPGSGDLGAGKTVAISLVMSKPVVVTGAPVLRLNDGGTAAYNASQSTSTDLVFDYTVTAGQNTADLKVAGVGLPSGSSIQDLAGNNAALQGAVATLGIEIDTRAPTVRGVAAAASSKDLNAGKTAEITLTTSEPVTVSGAPALTLDDGGVATYDAALSSATALTFDYTVLAGQNTTALKITGFSPAGSIQDLAGNALTAIPATNLGLQVDTVTPAVTAVTSSPAHGTVNTGRTIAIAIKMNEAVTVSGTPALLLNDGGTAMYNAAGSTATSLVFDYTAPSNQGTASLSVTGLELPSPGAIKDAAGNVANLSGAAATLGLKVNSITTGPANVTVSGGSEAEIFGASSQNVTFAAGADGTLKLDSAQSYTGGVSGLTESDTLDLSNLAYGPNMTLGYSGTSAGGILSVGNGSQNANIALLGNYIASTFTLSSDGHGGTSVVDPPMIAAMPLAASLKTHAA
jgi:hypothetical protein